MRSAARSGVIVWLVATLCVAWLYGWSMRELDALGNPARGTGYVLLGLTIGLGLYNGRKKLAMMPLGRISSWLTVHVVGGIAAVLVYAFHARTLWPLGTYERVLAALFYAVTVSGLAGYSMQLIVPRRLTQAGREWIYERIPGEIARIRDEVEGAVLAAAAESGNDTLSRHYFETLAWYFARPRFLLRHVLGERRAEQWWRRQIDIIGRYLTDAEKRHLKRILDLGTLKAVLDHQYALQSMLKRWTLVHVPLAAALVALAVWHFFVVSVFA